MTLQNGRGQGRVTYIIKIWVVGLSSAHCDELPSVPNARVVNGNTLVGNSVNYSCETGYFMSNNLSTIETTCFENRTWSDDLLGVSCEGNLSCFFSLTTQFYSILITSQI